MEGYYQKYMMKLIPLQRMMRCNVLPFFIYTLISNINYFAC